ncbi:RpiB/LacA/LacB family sugar-phosphate isomerase, partial [Acinetobacter baumannii]
MRIAIAADHAGFDLKAVLRHLMTTDGHTVTDLGTQDPNLPDDYPDFARLLAEEIISERAERGILVCGSGVGASVAANK